MRTDASKNAEFVKRVSDALGLVGRSGDASRLDRLYDQSFGAMRARGAPLTGDQRRIAGRAVVLARSLLSSIRTIPRPRGTYAELATGTHRGSLTTHVTKEDLKTGPAGMILREQLRAARR